MYYFGNSREDVPTQVMYGVPIVEETFNARFTKYEGTQCTATQVKSLMSDIATSNAVNGANSSEDERYVQYIGTEREKVSSNKTYTVELKYDEKGYVCEVIVIENMD